MRTTQSCSSGAENGAGNARLGERPPSLLSADRACAGVAQRGELVVSGAGVFWLEPDTSSGTNVLWRWAAGRAERLGPPNLSIRSKLNGYGGGSLAALDSGVFLISEDQQIHFMALDGGCQRLTDEKNVAFGGLVADPQRRRVLAVREAAGRQQLVAISPEHGIQCLHKGQDFYGAPTLSEDGRRLAWVSWQWPDMPWVRTTVWTAVVTEAGFLRGCETWPTPKEGSIQQPLYNGSELWVLSDHEGWWQPWHLDPESESGHWMRGVGPQLDHANAPWQLGESHHVSLHGGGWARVRYRDGIGELWLFGGAVASRRVLSEYTDFRYLRVARAKVYCIARSPGRLDAVVEIDPRTGSARILAGGEVPEQIPQPVLPLVLNVPSEGPGAPTLSGFFYPPAVTEKVLPPLILLVHGGPTSAAYAVFNPQIQYWCQRGFAVAEVNYRGSSGFGRHFRLALKGQWGVVDAQDMERTADHLADGGYVDRRQIFIQGRSSGGYTVLMTLARSRRFAAGASLFGVTDPLQLRASTHRFESGYLDWLLGSPHLHPQRWQSRTPRYLTDRIQVPVIFFQGGQDQVVVPEQTLAMVAALKSAGSCPELHWFEDEGHGFRLRANQANTLEWLYAFYQRQRPKINECGENLS